MLNYWKFIIKKLNDSFKTTNLDFKTLDRNFEPYQNNGGLVLSITGKKFCIIASDTRISMGYSIPSRITHRILKVSDFCLLGSSGMVSDINLLHEKLKNEIFRQRYLHNTKVKLINIVYLISSILYSRRFFPFYAFNLITGIDEHGKGINYSYDAIGSFDKNQISAVGHFQSSAQTILDFIKKEKTLNEQKYFNINHTVSLIKIIFLTLCSKQVEVGDALQLYIITKKGILIENSILRLD